jgi:16S rRNA (guanine1207-N2)-methyltransferase
MSIPKKRRPQTQRGQGHYFQPEPTAPSRPRIITLVLKDVTLRLQTDSAVFSAERVDPGTQVLLAEAPLPPAHGELLDLGCGYGAVALTLATRAPQARVWAVDVNQRALELTRLNAETAGLRNVVVSHPQEVPAGLSFAAIYSNPPVRVGKAALHDLLLSWLPRLEPGAAAYLVVQSHLGSDSLARWLATQEYQVRRLTSKRSYRVLEVRRQTG